jgi:hypothetical protein
MDSRARLLADGSVQVPANLAADLAPEARHFLTTVGLPTRDELFFPFLGSPADFEIFEDGGSRYLAISEEDGGQRLAVRIPDGAVVIVGDAQAKPRDVNSSPEQLVDFLGLYEDVKEQVADDTLSADDGVARLRHEFEQRDPAGLADEESWWSVILTETEAGMM